MRPLSTAATENKARRTEPDASITQRIERLGRLAWLLDKSIRLPGGFRVGLDGIVGLIPGIGDVSSFAVSLYIINQARRLGAPTSLILRMLWNVTIDTLIGAIPLIGDAFDFFLKANLKNIRLLQDHLERKGLV